MKSFFIHCQHIKKSLFCQTYCFHFFYISTLAQQSIYLILLAVDSRHLGKIVSVLWAAQNLLSQVCDNLVAVLETADISFMDDSKLVVTVLPFWRRPTSVLWKFRVLSKKQNVCITNPIHAYRAKESYAQCSLIRQSVNCGKAFTWRTALSRHKRTFEVKDRMS